MKKTLSERIATYGLFFILLLMISFHLLILTGVVPYTMVWGGRLSNHMEMIRFEAFSIIGLLLMLFVVAVYAGLLNVKMHRAVMRVSLGLMTGLFFINTTGNIQSVNEWERMIFSPLTFLLFLFSLRLYLVHRSSKSTS